MDEYPSVSNIKVETCQDDKELLTDIKIEICEDDEEEELLTQIGLPPEDGSEDIHVENFDKAILSHIEKYHTRRATQWSLYCWNVWRQQRVDLRNSNGEDAPYFYELCSQPIKNMDTALAYFILSCKNKFNENYSPVTLRSILFGLQRYMKAFAEHFNKMATIFIKNEHQFPNYCNAFRKRIKELKGVGIVNKNPPASGITLTQEESLWNTGLFGSHSSEAISNTVFFYIVKIFGIVSSQALRKLSTDLFVFGENEFGQYVELENNFAKTIDEFSNSCSSCCHNQALLVFGTNKLRHYRNKDNPRSFYNIMQYYLKLLESAPVPPDKALFLQPKEKLKFSANPIGKNQLQRKFGSIMKAANFGGSYTTQALVLSTMDYLVTKSYYVRRKCVFQTEQQVEISILLDPPIGIGQSFGITTQTNAFHQLVGASPISQLITGTSTQQPVTYIVQTKPSPSTGQLVAVQVGQQPNTNVQQVPITLIKNPHILTTYQKSSNNLKHILPKQTSDSCIQQVQQPNFGTVELQHNFSNETHAKSNTKKYDIGLIENDNSLFQDDEHVDENHKHPNDKGNECSFGDTTIIIKQELSECGETDEKDLTETNTANLKSVNNNNSTGEFRKRKCSEHLDNRRQVKVIKVNTNSERSMVVNGIQEPNKMCNEEQGAECTDDNLHDAEIEYTFTNDFDKKTVKQEVNFKEDDTTVFSCCGQSRAGRIMTDIDINFGDYLPENCIIRPNDIDMKRVIFPDGGKLVLKLKYKLDK